jgi:hypothetical protein
MSMNVFVGRQQMLNKSPALARQSRHDPGALFFSTAKIDGTGAYPYCAATFPL